MAFMSGNLCYQIEHHLFPDLPSNRYAEISVRVRALCEKYDLPYTTGPLGRQYWQSFWTILKLALPDKLLKATSDDAPETNSELKICIRVTFPPKEPPSTPRLETQGTADGSAGTADRGNGHRLAFDPRIQYGRPFSRWAGGLSVGSSPSGGTGRGLVGALSGLMYRLATRLTPASPRRSTGARRGSRADS